MGGFRRGRVAAAAVGHTPITGGGRAVLRKHWNHWNHCVDDHGSRARQRLVQADQGLGRLRPGQRQPLCPRRRHAADAIGDRGRLQPPGPQPFVQGRIAGRRGKPIAIVAVARRMLEDAVRMLWKQEAFRFVPVTGDAVKAAPNAIGTPCRDSSISAAKALKIEVAASVAG